MKKTLFCALCLTVFSGALVFGQAASFQRFDTQSSFIAANSSPTIVSYDSLSNARLPTYEYTFATEGVSIKPNDPAYTNPVWVNDWSTLLPGKEFALTGKEGMEFNFSTPVNAFGYDFIERVASIPGYEMAFTDSTFVISVYNGTTKLTEYTFQPTNDVATFFGISSTQEFNKVIIQETVGTVDDELYGKLYIKRNSNFSCPTDTVQTSPAITPITFTPNINPSLNTWQTAPISGVGFTPRAGHDVVAVNGKVYVFGGKTNNTEMYDPMTNTWTTKAPSPLPGTYTPIPNKPQPLSSGLMAAPIGDKIYVFSGKKVLEYNTVNDTWTTKNDNPRERHSGSAVTVDGKIYVIGGYSKFNQIYNPLTDKWSDAAPIPDAGYASYGFTYTQAAAAGGKIYLIGGVNMKTFQYYDPCSNTWTRLPDITIGPVGGGYYSSHSTVAVNGDIYVTGGISNQVVGGATLNAHWKYSTATQTWTNLTPTAPFPRAAYHLKGAVIGGKIYAISGASVADSNAPGYTLGYVYNAADSVTIDDSISACNCHPVCGEGKYFCATENICKPANQTCGTVTCNNNGICDPNESCNCADCNGESDHCDISSGKQMFCSDAGIPPGTGTATCLYPTVTTKTYTINVNARSNDTSITKTLTNLLPGTHEMTGSGQFIKCTTSNCGWSSGIVRISNNTPGYFLREMSNATRNWTVNQTLTTSKNEKLEVVAVQALMNGTLTVKSTVCGATPPQVGACCPVGTKWDIGANACIEDVLVCPSGQVKTVTPESPLCMLNIVPKVGGSDLFLEAYDHTVGNCVLASSATHVVPAASISPVSGSTGLTTSSLLQHISATTPASFLLTTDVSSLLTCPTGSVAHCLPGDGAGAFTCACYPNTLPAPASIEEPVYVCEVIGCAEGQYYCNAESTCKPANQTCGTVTCNNDGICNEYESCNCADCNQVADHCATNILGQQLLCSKDVIPAPSAVNTYFGGMYSTLYNNPITGAQSCPVGYVATQIFGTEWVDYPLFVCTRKVSDTSLPQPTQYFDFGGMYGNGGTPTSWVLENNPTTGANSCPAGYTTQQVLGDTKYMGPLWKCSCGGYTSMVSTTNLASGETCMYGNGGTEANTQYSSWSCTQIQSGASGTPLYTGPLYNCTCGGYMNRLSTTNLTSGETCMFGNGGTVNNDQYSSWSCTQLQSGVSGAPLYTGPLYNSTCGGYMNMVTTSNLTFGETCIYGNGGAAANVQFSAWTSTPLARSGFDNTLNYCWKARATAPTLANEDFGGVWGMRATTPGVWSGTDYNNPVTNAPTCPAGYTTKLAYGTDNVDWLLRWCYKGVPAIPPPPKEKWEAYSYSSAFIMLSKHPIAPSTANGQTFYVYNPERMIVNMTKAQFLADPVTAINNAAVLPIGYTRTPKTRLQFNMAQLLSETPAVQTTTVNNLKSSILSRFLCSTDEVGAKKCHANNLGVYIPAFSYEPTGPIYSSIHDGNGYVQTTAYQRFGTFEIPCKPYDYTTVRYIPNTNPTTQGWSYINGIGTAQNDGGKLVWQVNDGGTSEGKNAVIYKKLASTELDDFFTKGGKYSVQLKNLSASAPTSSAAALLASYIEIARGKNTTKGEKRFTFVFGMDVDKTPTIIGLTNNGATYTAPADSTYKYRVTGGADKYNLYEMVYDPATDTVDLLVNGVEQISDFPGNSVDPGYAAQINGSAAGIFGSGSSPGVAKTNYGDVQLTIKNASCPATGICPEGTYHSSSDNLCKPANELTLNPVCNKNNTCEIGESCNCSDCTNGGPDDKDACSTGTGGQMFCSRDTDFHFPIPVSSVTTFTNSALFLDQTKSTTFSYESLMLPTQSLRRILGPVFPFGTNAPSIKGYDVSSTYGDDRINFVRRQLLAPTSVNKLPAGSYYLNNVSMGFNSEKFDILFPNDIYAFGIEIYEPMGDNTISGCNSVCGESTFTFELYNNGTLVDNSITYNPANNQDTFFGFSFPQAFDEVRVRETTTTAGSYLGDNEFFGRIYYQDRSAGETLVPGKDLCTIGACCPVGKEWDCDTNSCRDNGSIVTQVGACCPPGSAWNSAENRCVPSTCGVGQFYCAAQKKCLPGGTTCDTTVCNNNGLCEGEESCQCGDCVDGPTQTDPTKKADDKDKCSIIGGIQAMCSDDNLTDNKPGACCLPPQTWNTATGTCQECTNTQAPSELKAGVDQPYISCTGNGDTTQTHFRYRITPLTGSLPITPTTTATNSNLTVTKLVAKAVSGTCPTDAAAYVPNLTGVVANDKLCVRLVYNNATTGAVSNALITDSVPAGFTRVTNSTKNCLTPTGSSELCSDSTDMGGAIGNNGWSGNNFSLTPHAGFYAIPTTQSTPATMEKGTKRYLINCTVPSSNTEGTQITHTNVLGAVNTSPGFTSKENNWSLTLNPQPTNAQCAALIGHTGTFWNNTNSGYQPSQVDILGRRNLLSCNLIGGNYNVYLPLAAVNVNPGFTNRTTSYGPVTPQATNTECATLAGYPHTAIVYNNTTYSGQPGQIDLTEGRYLLSCMYHGYNNVQYLSQAVVSSNPGFTSKENNWSLTLNPQPTNAQCASLVGNSQGGTFNNTGSGGQPYQTDLLDTANGKGYIQYMVEATATPSNLALPSATLAGTTTTADTSSANATINVSANAATGTPYTSINSFAVGTQVLHTATPFTEGTYKVECFYGTATNVPTDTLSTPHACVKNINVKAANDSTAQGCSRILAYRDSTLSNEMASPGGFKATFRCGSRLPVTEAVTNPYQFRFGTNPIATLQYDSIISEFFNGLGIGPVSTQTQNYDIPNNNTDISCAMKVGGGYSTNNACKTTTCVGATCSLPQTFSVVNSQNVTCTPDASSEYDIGCNSAADDTTRKFCAKWFKDAFDNRPNKSVSDFQTYFTFGGAHALIDCTQYTANDPRFGGLNMYENFVCTTTLPNGEKVEIFGAEKKPDNSIGAIAALQTTAYTVKRDTDKPVLSALKFYSGSTVSESTYIADQSRWQKSPVTAAVTCTNTPFSDGNYCVCAPHVAAVSTVAGIPGTTTPDLWSSGIPDATVGADIMRYTRTITTSLNGATVAVRDTAGNISPDARTISIGVDTVAPTVNITTTGTAPSLAVTITATDNTGGSGIWKDNIQTQTYLATAPVPTFDDKCNVTSSDALLYESYSPTGTPLALTKSTATPITLNTSTHKLAYCIQDNAGNITKGFYPSVPVACFSSTNLPTVPGTTPSTIPSIATYVAPLIARIAPATGVGQFGYGMSTDATNANCFRGIITSNVTRLISNQYNASTASTVDWSAPAKVKSNPTLSNTNGYYYHTALTNNLLTITSSPSGTGPKVVYAEGADIQINTDINYRDSSTTTNSNTLLIIIAKRATTGANPAGGNIYINPSVKNIDAILITDGTIMNGVNGLAKDYITNPTDLINRLTINGRIYSMNTRGGSIDSSILTSNNLGMITTNSGKVFANNASLTTNASPATAAAQDLERFRVINDDGNKQCTLFLNYKTIPINTLPPILQRPSGYAGGACGF